MRSMGFAALAVGLTAASSGAQDSMTVGQNGFTVSDPLVTIGETFSGTTGALNSLTAGDYTPPGILDGLGAYELDANTVRVFANHELLNFRGYAYEVFDGLGGTFSLTGARVSYFDIDKTTRQVVDTGLAYDEIFDSNGVQATDLSIFNDGFGGYSRFCSSALFEAGTGGLEDTIYFTNEEDGGFFNPVGGLVWALDVVNGDMWAIPGFGRGAWENVTLLETGDDDKVAFILADDSSPFDFDGDDVSEAVPLYLYVGEKDEKGDFLARNGLRDGDLYVWVSDTGDLSPLDFAGTGTRLGQWVEVDNDQQPALASNDGSTGFDRFGYPTQGNLVLQAEALGAFGFSRPEDVSTNPNNGLQIVLASTGVDTYAVGGDGNGADTFGTLYLVTTDLDDLSARVSILYDGDADAARTLRSPDNLDWADDGKIYVQEDEAEEDSLTGEPLFGPGAANANEAGIVRVDPTNGSLERVANIDRSVILDGSLADPTLAVDVDAGAAGEWESSGIIDVSTLFGEVPGTLFLFDVQAHGIEDQTDFNPTSRINDGDLVEGGQLLFLEALAGEAFADLGNGLAGTNGVPLLEGEGTVTANDDVAVLLTNALENSTASLVVGFSELSAPFKGGVLVPTPDIVFPGLATGPIGSIELESTFPGGVPAGLDVILQYWVVDGGAVEGLSASNAIGATTP